MKKASIVTFFVVMILSIFISSAHTSDTILSIYIDPGHGGYDGGACVGEVKESVLTLEISKKLKEVMEKNGINVLLTRETEEDLSEDEFIKREDMLKRINLINQSSACLAVSIHLNKFSMERYKGSQVFYSNINENNKLLAQNIQSSLKEYLKNTDRKIVSRDNIFLLNKVTKPCCIIECGFMSNKEELSLLQSEDYQYKLAHAIFYGIEDYLKLY